MDAKRHVDVARDADQGPGAKHASEGERAGAAREAVEHRRYGNRLEPRREGEEERVLREIQQLHALGTRRRRDRRLAGQRIGGWRVGRLQVLIERVDR